MSVHPRVFMPANLVFMIKKKNIRARLFKNVHKMLRGKLLGASTFCGHDLHFKVAGGVVLFKTLWTRLRIFKLVELSFVTFYIGCPGVKSRPHQLFAVVTFISRLQEFVMFKTLWIQ